MNDTADLADAEALVLEAGRVTARLEEERRRAGIAKRDLEPYRRGNAGIPYAFTFDSGRAGPHVLVTSLAHGNEPGGLEAVLAILEHGIRPLCGRLSLAICNVAAYEAFNGVDPYGTRFVEEDFNRVWSDEKLDGEGHSVELDRARELRPLVADADFLIDLHATPYEASPYFVLRPGTRAIGLAERIGLPHTRFLFNQGSAHAPTLSNYRQFSDPHSNAIGITLECGLFFAAESKLVAQAAVARLLQLNGMISDADFAALATWRDTRPRRDIVVEYPEITRTAQMRFLARPGDFQPFAEGEIAAFDGDRPIPAPFEGALVLWIKQTFEKDVQAFMWGRIVRAADGRPA
ncbi:succinylglutamate desuccinylase/aspartoacylase family protein [Chelativorans sp.]|uniref:succinylglutamate desuccinylase/aspartoacylase domain-containing protein n=1 Tax=Chelativorans sp. TaxID=2203393 RepID=UPI002812865C|nr:succinylglutamate desuccinylase/aspartoacylase family protein [Chelativorans sp.]